MDQLTQGERGVETLRRIWMGLRRNDHMWRFEDWWSEIDPTLRAIVVNTINGDHSAASTDFWSVRSSLLFGGGVGALALGPIGFIAGALAGAAVSGAIQNISSDAIQDVFRVLGSRAQALLNLNPVRELMAQSFDRSRFDSWVQSGKKLRLAAVALGSGQLGYVNERGEVWPRFGSAAIGQGVDILEAALASSAMAAVFPPGQFAGDLWVDGGHRENIPLRVVLDEGATRVFVICASPIDPISSLCRTENGLMQPTDFSKERILAIAERALLGMHLDELAAGDVYPLLSGGSAEITVIAPRFPTHDIMTIDPELVRANYNYGYRQAYDAVHSAADPLRETSDTLALNDGRIARLRRRVWHQVSVPMHASIPDLRQQNAVAYQQRADALLRVTGPVTYEALPCGSDLVPGDRMLPGQAIASPDGRFRLLYQADGNLVLYREERGRSVPLWATGTDGRPLGVVVMQRDGNLVMYTEDVVPLWASATHGQTDARLRVQNDGNVVIHLGERTIWETRTSQLNPGPGSDSTPVVRAFTMVNASPTTIRVRYFKVDDPVHVAALPGGEFTLAPGERVDWNFPPDVSAATVVVNQHQELRAEPGQTVTFSADERVAITNRTTRAIAVRVFNDQDILHIAALPGGEFRVEVGATGYWEFPGDIQRADVFVNNLPFETVLRGSQITYANERRVFFTNQTAITVNAKFFRADDTWRWVTLAKGDLQVQGGQTIEYEIPPELNAVQIVVQNVRANAGSGDRLALLGNGQLAQL